MFAIELTPEAVDDLRALRKRDQVEAVAAMETQLVHEPMSETQNRKRLRPNPLAEWELRAGKLRVLYNVDEGARLVRIEAVGFKIRNLLFVRGRRRDL